LKRTKSDKGRLVHTGTGILWKNTLARISRGVAGKRKIFRFTRPDLAPPPGPRTGRRNTFAPEIELSGRLRDGIPKKGRKSYGIRTVKKPEIDRRFIDTGGTK